MSFSEADLNRVENIIAKAEMSLKVVDAVCSYLIDTGVCEDADDDESYCTNTCSYCDLVRALDKWSR